MKRFFHYLHKPEAIFFQFSVLITLHCLGVIVNTESTEEPRFIWLPNEDGSGVVKAYLEEDLSPGRRRVDENAIKFFLYTHKTQFTPREINKNIQLKSTNFNFKDPVKVVIHGYTGGHMKGFSSYIKDAYLNTADCNVICVDWSPLSGAPAYYEATRNAKVVGKVVATFIQKLQTDGVPSAAIHVIGHSLGAHAAGFVGAELGGKLTRVTGLDPAAPLYKNVGTGERLDSSDARFVDVIHTTGGIVGLQIPCGHADFYPNGGTRQPGCGLDVLGTCSHARSFKYFGESVSNPRGFKSCSVCGGLLLSRLCGCNYKMGVECDSSTRGRFSLRTSSAPPFAKG